MWQERVLKCIKMVQELSSNSSISSNNSSSTATSVPQSPIGVLDAAACLSYKSDDINDGSCSNSSLNNSPDAKRRKLNKTCGVEL